MRTLLCIETPHTSSPLTHRNPASRGVESLGSYTTHVEGRLDVECAGDAERLALRHHHAIYRQRAGASIARERHLVSEEIRVMSNRRGLAWATLLLLLFRI